MLDHNTTVEIATRLAKTAVRERDQKAVDRMSDVLAKAPYPHLAVAETIKRIGRHNASIAGFTPEEIKAAMAHFR